MTRISSLAIHQLNLARTLATQTRLFNAQIQISSGQVSQDYTGLALDSRRLVSLKNAQLEANNYIGNIDVTDRRMQTMETTATGAMDIASRLRVLLVDALNLDNASVMALNLQAESLLREVVGQLNVKQDDRFLFAGSRTDTLPIDLDVLLATSPPLVDAAEFTGAATTSGTGITGLTGIVSVQVESGTNGDAFQLAFNSGTNTFTMTNLNGLASQQLALGAVPGPGQTSELTFNVGGKRVVLTIDENFDDTTSITTDTVTGNVSGGAGAFGAITVTGTTGDVSKINQNTIEITGAAASATLTLNSTDGNFVVSAVDLTGTGVQSITLTNATTNATFSLNVDVTVALDDAAVANANTEIRLDNFLENVAASDGTINTNEARPGDIGYDSSNPSYYRGDSNKLSVRIGDDMTVEYGVTADDSAFEKLIRALYTVKNANVTPGNIDRATLENALGLAVEAIGELPVIVSEIGANRLTLQNFKNRHEDFLVFTQETVSQIENVDVAEAISRLSSEQLLLEASYTLIAQLRQLSLANFL